MKEDLIEMFGEEYLNSPTGKLCVALDAVRYRKKQSYSRLLTIMSSVYKNSSKESLIVKAYSCQAKEVALVLKELTQEVIPETWKDACLLMIGKYGKSH